MQQEIIKEDIVLLPAASPYSSPCIILSDEGAGWGIIDKFGLGDILKSYTPYHMYITDNTPIKEGDWYIHDAFGQLAPVKCNTIIQMQRNKIIGTNNPKLIADGVPAISDEFISRWVSVQGKEYKIIVEMEDVLGLDDFFPNTNQPKKYKPKLSNNQLILSIVEEKQVLFPESVARMSHIMDNMKEAHSVEDSEIEKVAQKYSESEKGYPYDSFRGTIVGIDDKHTGQALRGAYVGGFCEAIEWYKSRQPRIYHINSMFHPDIDNWSEELITEYAKYREVTSAETRMDASEWLKTQTK